MSHLEAALKFYQPAGYRTETSNALILLGRVYCDKGEYAVAMKAFTEQLALAKQSGDPARLAATHSSIGVLLGDHQEQYAEALPYFAESYRINTSLGARVSMGWDQVNRAASLAALGRYDEAAAALDEARAIAAGADAQFKSQLAYVEVIGAQIALSLGDRVQARTRATAALSLADPDYKDTALQARQTLALTQASTGAPKAAVTLVEDAVERGTGSRKFPGSFRRRCSRRPKFAWPAATAGARSLTRRPRSASSRRAGNWSRSGARGWCRHGPCGSRATARWPTTTPSVPRRVARLSRRAGATTTTAATRGGPISTDVCRSSRNCSSAHGRSTHGRRTGHGS